MRVVTVDQAITLIEANAPIPRSQKRALGHCEGRTLLQDVVACRDQPPFVSSAMDGYAIIHSPDSAPPGTGNFTVVGESQAGKAYLGGLNPGEAVRIFTGAPVPQPATTVIIQENVTRTGDRIAVSAEGMREEKTHIRPAGQDFKTGDTVARAGERLDAWRLSLVAATGASRICVAARPRIAILCTGNELVPPGGAVRDDQIFESTSFGLMSLVRVWGGKPTFVGVEGDSLKGIAKALRKIEAELIVTVGGASVGDYDLVKPAMRSLGYEPSFDKVDLRPGRPTSFGVLKDGTSVLSLPGNPASAFVCAQLFLKPFIERSLGRVGCDETLSLPCADALTSNGERQAYLRAKIVPDNEGRQVLKAFADQDSALIQVFALSDALVVRPVRAPATLPGDLVPFIRLDRR